MFDASWVQCLIRARVGWKRSPWVNKYQKLEEPFICSPREKSHRYQIGELRLWSIRIFQVNKGTSTAAQGTASEDKSSLHCCYPQRDYAYVISTILKLVLNFVYNFVIFLLLFFRINIFVVSLESTIVGQESPKKHHQNNQRSHIYVTTNMGFGFGGQCKECCVIIYVWIEPGADGAFSWLYCGVRWVDRVPIWLNKVTFSSKWVGEPD